MNIFFAQALAPELVLSRLLNPLVLFYFLAHIAMPGLEARFVEHIREE